ncbi:NUDIX hydrolase [Candidatus Gracilibacteria bacterium]|nr:NUDIX hydrolase [Candidatus Gracilibacteria bacterium]
MQEIFDIVDKNDQVIQYGVAENDLHVNDDITRVTTAYITDAQGRFYIAQRSPNKKVDPLKYEAPAHGRVQSRESYEDAICRETLEELGVKLDSFEEIGHFYLSFESNVGIRQHYKKLFIGKISEGIKIDPTEIHAIKSFDSIVDFFDFYETQTHLFSDAIAYDIQYLKDFFT